MNEAIKKVLFGNQKQSLKQNIAITNFVEDYLVTSYPESALGDSEAVSTVISTALKELVDNPPEQWMLTDKLFVEYTLGVEAFEAISKGVAGDIRGTFPGDSGKVVFSFVPTGMTGESTEDPLMEVASRAKAVADSYVSDAHEKAATAEDKAWDLVREIIAACPPSQRAELPEDDVLAAVLLSESYWRAMM